MEDCLDGGIADAVTRAFNADPTRRQTLMTLAAPPLALAWRPDADAKKAQDEQREHEGEEIMSKPTAK